MSGRREYSEEIFAVCGDLCFFSISDPFSSLLANSDLVEIVNSSGSGGGWLGWPKNLALSFWRLVAVRGLSGGRQ